MAASQITAHWSTTTTTSFAWDSTHARRRICRSISSHSESPRQGTNREGGAGSRTTSFRVLLRLAGDLPRDADECPEGRRHLGPAREVEEQPWHERRVLLEDVAQLAAAQLARDHGLECVDEANSRHGQEPPELGIVRDDRPLYRDAPLLLSALELPGPSAAAGRRAHADAVVLEQVGRLLRGASAREVRRSPCHDE